MSDTGDCILTETLGNYCVISSTPAIPLPTLPSLLYPTFHPPVPTSMKKSKPRASALKAVISTPLLHLIDKCMPQKIVV